jgi:gentisate 1,2-dioxygenase
MKLLFLLFTVVTKQQLYRHRRQEDATPLARGNVVVTLAGHWHDYCNEGSEWACDLAQCPDVHNLYLFICEFFELHIYLSSFVTE